MSINGRLYRSRRERMIAGVAGGMAESLGLDPSLVRIVWVILIFLTGGLLLLLYLAMIFIVPEQPWPAGDTWRAVGSGGTGPEGAAGGRGGGSTAPEAGPGDIDQTAPTGSPSQPFPAVPTPSVTNPIQPMHGQWPESRHRGGALGVIVGLLLLLVGGIALSRQFVPGPDWGAIGLIGVGVILVLSAIRRT